MSEVQFVLYGNYKVEDVLELPSHRDDAIFYCGGQWIVLPERIFCFCQLGTSESEPHLNWSSNFCWVADQEYSLENAEFKSIPDEIRRGRNSGRAIYLLAKPRQQDNYIYLGQLSPANSVGTKSTQKSYLAEYGVPHIHFLLSANHHKL